MRRPRTSAGWAAIVPVAMLCVGCFVIPPPPTADGTADTSANPPGPCDCGEGATCTALGGSRPDNTCQVCAPGEVFEACTWGCDDDGSCRRVASLHATPMSSHTVARLHDGTLWGFGYGKLGVLGVDALDVQPPKPITGIPKMATVSAGGAHACGLAMADGQVWCWGIHVQGPATARGEQNPGWVPAPKDGLQDARVLLNAINDGVCAIENDGDLRCWEDPWVDMDTLDLTAMEPVELEGTAPTNGIVSGVGERRRGCYIDGDGGRIRCWGNPCWQGDCDGSASATPVTLANVGNNTHTFVAVHVWGSMACALTDLDRTFCWGVNNGIIESQLVGASFDNPQETEPSIGLALGRHSCRITPAGQAYCWGQNLHGEAGAPSSEPDVAKPRLVPLPYPATEVTVGDNFSCALTEPGFVYCWGSNYYGTLGDGQDDDAPHPTPQRVRYVTPENL